MRILCLVAGIAIMGSVMGVRAQVPDASSHSAANSALQNIERFSANASIEFIPNLGQLSEKHGNPVPDVLFSAEYRGLTTYFAKSAIHFYFTKRTSPAQKPFALNPVPTQPDKSCRLLPPVTPTKPNDTLISYRFDMTFVGANPAVHVVGQEKGDDYINYYIPRFPNGLTDVPTYREVLYKDLYPSIDLIVFGSANGMKYDFIVREGGDPAQIKMHYDGPDSLMLDDSALHIFTPFGAMTEASPLSFQTSESVSSALIVESADAKVLAPESAKHVVDSRFVIQGHDVSFAIGSYDHSVPLVIDPSRLWGTYYGGNSYDYFVGSCIDRTNNILATGTALSAGLGTVGTYQDTLNTRSGYPYDAMIVKFSPAGSRIWATYFGGGLEEAWAVAVDPSNNVIDAGSTWDDTCVASPGAYQTQLNNQSGDFAWDTYVAKFDSSGHRYWSTYLGTPDTDIVYDLAVDSNSNIYITGYTNSTTGLGTPGAFKMTRVSPAFNDYGGFLSKFTPTGNLAWSTYIGDTGVLGLCVCTTPGNNVVAGGETYTFAGMTTNGVYETYQPNYVAGYLLEFSAAGSRLWGTYVDGLHNIYYYGSVNYGVTCSSTGDIYTSGITWADSGLGTSGAYRTSFPYGDFASYVERFDGTGNRLSGTYYTNSHYYFGEYGFRVAADIDGGVAMVGWGSDSLHVATPGAFQTVKRDSVVSYLAKFNTSCARVWGTYFEGDGRPTTWDPIYGVCVDRYARKIISGGTGSDSGMTTSGAFQTVYGGDFDGFLEMFCDTLSSPLHFSSSTARCYGMLDTVIAPSGYASYQWEQNGTPITGATQNSYIVPSTLAPGSYQFTVDINDPRVCAFSSDTAKLVIRSTPTLSAGPDQTICLNDSVQIGGIATSGKTPYAYQWAPDSGLSSATIATPRASPVQTTQYIVIVTDSNGCQARDTVIINVRQPPIASMTPSVIICQGSSAMIGAPATGGVPPITYTWTPAAGLSSTTIAQPIATPTNSTTYHVHIVDANGCGSWDSVIAVVTAKPVVTINPPGPIAVCAGDSVLLSSVGSFMTYAWSTGQSTPTIHVSTPGSYYLNVTDINGCSGFSDTVAVSAATSTPPVISGPLTACPQSSTNYSARLDSASTYAWSLPGAAGTVTQTGVNTATVKWNSAGVWNLTVQETNAAGCSADTTISVNVNSTLTPVISPAGPITLCNGDTAILTTSSGFTSYSWNTGATTDSIIVTKSGSYTVSVTGTGGCVGTSQPVQVTVLTQSKPVAVIQASPAATFCAGDSATLSTTQPFTTYLWSNGASVASIKVGKAGTYSVVVSNAAGCTSLPDSIAITVSPSPVVTITPKGPTSFCQGDSVLLAATAGGANYLWSDGETSSSIEVSQSGSYTVSITNASGCTATSVPISVTVNAFPDATVTGPAAACPGSVTTYSVPSQNGATYNWAAAGGTIQSGQGTNTINVSWTTIGTGEILLTATNASGCSSTDSLSITIDNTLTPVVKAHGALTFCQGDSVMLDAGAGYASYQWQNNGTNLPNATNETLQVNASGSYAVFVSNGASCSGTSKPVVVTVNPNPPIPVITLNGGSLLSSAAAKYQWMLDSTIRPGATLDSITSLATGFYNVTVFDTNGCSSTSLPYYYQEIDSTSSLIAVPPMLTASPGSPVALPIEMLKSIGLAKAGAVHYEAKIRFNNTLLAPTGATPAGQMQGGDMIVTISGTNPLALGTTTGTLATLNFLATLGNDTCTPIAIDEFTWTDGSGVTVTTQNGEFCLTGVCVAGGQVRLINPNTSLTLSEPHPNPATSQTEVDYSLDEQGQTDLYITDMLGREVKHVLTGTELPGSYSAEVDLQNIPQGTYLCILRTPSGEVSRLFQVVR